MKLHLSRFAGQNAFNGYGQDHVLVNGQRYERSLIVLPDQLQEWAPADPGQARYEELLGLPVEILLLGTGRRLRFPHPSVVFAFRQRGIGLEVMDTPAACRTYNILLAEARKVGAAVMIDATTAPLP